VISVSRSFNLVAKSPKDRDDWMKALNGAIEDNIKKKGLHYSRPRVGISVRERGSCLDPGQKGDNVSTVYSRVYSNI